jgi:hypothetical protein
LSSCRRLSVAARAVLLMTVKARDAPLQAAAFAATAGAGAKRSGWASDAGGGNARKR